MQRLILTVVTVAFAAGSLATFVEAAGKPKAKAGRCGENMYYSAKTHKCMDARNK
jgi:hypothetical protein